jgi:uncharacterized protein
MKALLILLVIAAGAWLWRRGRRRPALPTGAPPKLDKPQPMLRCACCGVHLPAGSAIMGRAGRAYCCAAHQRQAEGG